MVIVSVAIIVLAPIDHDHRFPAVPDAAITGHVDVAHTHTHGTRAPESMPCPRGPGEGPRRPLRSFGLDGARGPGFCSFATNLPGPSTKHAARRPSLGLPSCALARAGARDDDPAA